MLQQRLLFTLSWLYTGVLVLMPLHAFLTTLAGGALGHLDVWRIWKEALIFVTIPAAIYLGVSNPAYLHWLKTSWLPRLIGLYILLHLLWGVVALRADSVNSQALIYSLLSNLRFLGFFLLVTVVATRSPFLRRYALRSVMITGLVVMLFGLLQLVLPLDFLARFGYGPDTIPAYHTVDNKLDYQRIQSTLRGPNPLGAYLVLILSLLVAYWRLSLGPFSWKLVGYALVLFATLFFSYSRSAYLGALVSMGIIVLAALIATRFKKYLLPAACLLVMILGGSVFLLRDNNAVQNTLFHSDETSPSSISSNAGRMAALQNGVYDVTHEPFGRGPGTAGPASMRNRHPPRISENYYLQLGQEVGWLGIGLFVAINVWVGRLLWLRRSNYLGLALFASLIGLSVVSLVSHAWADDTLGLLWWGLAGIALAPAILKTREKPNETQASQKAKTRS